MTARFEERDGVRFRVQKATRTAYSPRTFPRWYVTGGTQVWLVDASSDTAAVAVLGYGRGYIDDGTFKVRKATDEDVGRIVDILGQEREVKAQPKPSVRPKVRKLNPVPKVNTRPTVPELFGGKVKVAA